LRFAGAAYGIFVLSWLDLLCSAIRAFELPTTRGWIGSVHGCVLRASNVKFVPSDYLLIAGRSVDLLVMAAANDRIASFSAKFVGAFQAGFLRIAVD
jgi:hypothetical protein